MASQSQKNILAVLALCEGSALIVERQYKGRPRNKTAMTVCSRVKSACQEASRQWKTAREELELAGIHSRLKKVEEALYLHDEVRTDVSRYTSLCLALLSDLYGYIRDESRLWALEQLHSAMWQMHKRWDQDLCRRGDYQIASRAAYVFWRAS